MPGLNSEGGLQLVTLRRGIALVAALAASITLAGCAHKSTHIQGTPPSSLTSGTTAAGAAASSATPTTTARPPDLNAELMSLTDMPAGWSVDKSSSSGVSTTGCFANIKEHFNSKEKAEADYQDGSDGIPEFDEALSWLPGQSQQALAAITTALNGCGQVSFTSGGSKFTGTVGEMSFPTVGDQSDAWQVNLSGKVSGLNITVGIDIAVFRKGDTDGALIYDDLGTPDLATFEQLTNKAVAKVTG
jgi:hypothetical protein